ncbi:MAG: PEP-utilizing enzyme [Chloroflexi bacterium]|nr:PEP-utilizing enzyme [Chloroflexota bacterium]
MEQVKVREKALLPLDSPAATLALVGGKGANLAKLARHKFPVPGGFLVTTQAYWAFIAVNQLDAWLQATVNQANLNEPASLEMISAKIRARFTAGRIPPDLADDLRAAYAQLGQPPVAVRSSATAEDLPEMSFAGQQDTYLNILGEAELLKAVVNCWGSLWTARAIGYRARNGIAQHDVALAVVVQEMVQSEASGVLFTANPLTGKRSETTIDATLGLGEALVSGQVEPDHYVVDTASGRLLSKTLGAKALLIQRGTGSGTVTIQQDAAHQQALSDVAIGQLAALGRKVADFYQTPQDIEWAWAEHKLYLLQARPITSLFPVPADVSPDQLDVFISFGAIQGVLDPITPLGRDGLVAIFAAMAKLFGVAVTPAQQTTLETAGERLWPKVTTLLQNKIGRKLIKNATSVIEPNIRQALDEVLQAPTTVATSWPSLTTARNIATFLLPRLAGNLQSLLQPDQSRVTLQQEVAMVLQRVEARAAATKTLSERIAFFEDTLTRETHLVIPLFLDRVPAGLLMMNRLLAMANQAWAADEQQKQRILEITRGLPHNVTTEMDLVLWSTAQQIREDAAAFAHVQTHDAATLAEQYLAQNLPKVAQDAIALFLKRYGMRGVAEIDLGRTRWRENPVQVMQMVQSYLQIADPALAPDAMFRRGEAVAQQVIDDLVAVLRHKPEGARQARLVRWMAHRMRALAGLRESPKFFLIQMMGIVRQTLLQSGEELVQQAVLDRPDDIFFLQLEELKGLAAGYLIDWKALVIERRALYEREKLRRQIPRVLLSDGRAFYGGAHAATPDQVGVLSGTPVSPGMVEGLVHVVFDPHTSQLAPGEILVCPGTDPAWTPLFLTAGGLVMEVGGLMTHGSVVAREYGIPAVVGVHDATTRLQTGQRVRVDGARGEVVVLDATV